MTEVVISGISGRFPQSDNVEEFKKNLLNKVYLIGDPKNRVKFKFPGLPERCGLMNNIEKFDFQAFPRINTVIANITDPQSRILTENVFEAIIDSGINPSTLYGSNTGVYVGNFNYDSLEHWMCNKECNYPLISGANMGYSIPNRISYIFGLNGPSLTVDTACSSSMNALNLGYKDILNGECDSAIVIGTNLILNPFFTRSLSSVPGGQAMDCISKPYDKNTTGYVRSEACCVLFLQKSSNAARVYATILGSRTSNDGFKKEGQPFPSVKMQKQLYSQVFEGLKIGPNDVDFIEGHSTSTRVGDQVELTSIDEFFCVNRKTPLKVGSVKGNAAHTEAASGVVSMVKALFMFEEGKIIPNINITELRDDIPALVEGRIIIPQEVEDFKGDIICVNNFGMLGSNSHTVVQKNNKNKVDNGFPTDNLPRLLLWAGRTVDAVNAIFDQMSSKPIDDEFLALLQNSQIKSFTSTTTRGFAIFKSNPDDRSTICVERQIKQLEKSNRPIVFAYSGVGSQWIQMGRDLLKIPSISRTIDECHEILMTKGINLKNILISNSSNIFDNVLNIFVSVISVQIAITDLLRQIGINANYFIGHSVGEIACAYADGTVTRDQAVLMAYSRGMAILNGCKKSGSMAAVAMSYEELEKILPNLVEIACHNSDESCTITGPTENVQDFVKELKSKGTLAKVIDSAGIALHSSLIAECGPIYRKCLEEILDDPNPQLKTSKWISTSWKNDDEQNCSMIDYHVNNMTGKVLFADGMKKLPEGCLIIEIAPHGVLQSILKQSHPSGVCESLTKRDCENGVDFLLSSLGKIYQNGVDMNIRQIYPKIQFPVSRGTPMISPLIKWQHDVNLTVPMYDPFMRCDKRSLIIDLKSPKYLFLSKHKVQGRIIIPGVFYMYLASETFAIMHGMSIQEMRICIEDVKLKTAIFINEDKEELEITVVINRGSKKFEIVQTNETICEGRLREADKNEFLIESIGKVPENSTENSLTKEDFYKELSIRKYGYEDEFQMIQRIQTINGGFERYGEIEWNENVVIFVDNMVQPYIVEDDTRELAIPVSIRKIVIDAKKHAEMMENLENCRKIVDKDEKEKIIFDLYIDEKMKIYRCGGFELIMPEFFVINQKKKNEKPVLETYEFVPHLPTPKMSTINAAKFAFQLFMENTALSTCKIVEFNENDENEPFMKSMIEAINTTPLINPSCTLVTKTTELEIEGVEIVENLSNLDKIDILICSSLGENLKLMNENGFLLVKNSNTSNPPIGFKTAAEIQIESGSIFVYKKKTSTEFKPVTFEIPSALKSFEWVGKLKEVLENNNEILIYSMTDESGIVGFFKSLKKEHLENDLMCFAIEDEKVMKFDVSQKFYVDQIDLGLKINVYRNGKWGSYRHLNFNQEVEEKSHSEHVSLHQTAKGDLSSLVWVNGDIKDIKNINNTDEIIDIHYAALNFRDILTANSRISMDKFYDGRKDAQYQLGYEFSGISRKDGRKVIGLSDSKGFSNMIRVRDNSEDAILLNLPDDNMTLESAASIGMVYATVYLSFFIKAKIKAGESVLVHSGSGGIGQATIRVALGHGLKVYTTCGSQEKREFLLKEFTELKDEDIGNSRDLSFERMIMQRTRGRGVDYVMNSLSEDKMQASLRCLANEGTFFEVGKYDMFVGNNMNLKHFLKDIKFIYIHASTKYFMTRREELSDIENRIRNDSENGIVKPLKTTLFKANEIHKAFRYMASGKHTGKIVIKMRENDESKETLPIQLKPRVYFNPTKSYILTGGLGGMGMELADWMIMRNCMKLVLSSSRGISSSYQSYRIRIWETYGVKVEICTSNICTKEGCEELIRQATKLGPVGGIFNLAVVLKDRNFKEQEIENFDSSFGPKALSTMHLDEISRKMCPNLDHFVFFSSVSCGRGNGSQTNYALSNSFGEKIILKRQADDLCGKVIQWGPISDIGLLSKYDTMFEKKFTSLFGYTFQNMQSCCDVMDEVLMRDEPIFSSIICASKKNTKIRFDDSYKILLERMGISDESTIDETQTLGEFGVDSISGVEVQQFLIRELDVSKTLKEIRSLTFKEAKQLGQQKMQ